MIPAIIGLVLVGVGAFLIYSRRRSEDRLLEIKATHTSQVSDILEAHRDVAGEIGAGGFRQIVEVKGTVACDAPLAGELSGQPCVYYAMSVEERYEEPYEERDSNGNMRRGTRTGNRTVASNTQSVRFTVADDTGTITIDPTSADIDSQQVVSRYDPATGSGTSIGFGSFSMNLGSSFGGRRVLGYNYTESILPLSRRIYVLGEVSDTDGELRIGKPAEKGKPFIVSLKSEEEIVGKAESTIKWKMYGAVAAIVIGLALVVVGIVG